ncbi:MAG TPA: YafY family protein [Actinoplanes sp.]|nr:YafY family protein [Actinoplanes sp.]
MLTTSARLLRLASTLSSRQSWTNSELAGQMGVTERTVRRDVARLRELGYGIVSEAGPYGGYRLSVGTRLPPLSLDDEEALAVTIALREAALSGVLGGDQAAVSALLKLRQILPVRLADRLREWDASVVHTARSEAGQVAPAILLEVAGACRRGERLRLSYRDMQARETVREVDPYRLVRSPHRWYLVAVDTARGQWRTFRADRVTAAEPTGAPADLAGRPDLPDAAELISRMLLSDYPLYATVRVEMPLEQASRLVPPSRGAHRPDGPGATLITLGGTDPEELAAELIGLATPIEVVEPAEVRDAMYRRTHEILAALRVPDRSLRHGTDADLG